MPKADKWLVFRNAEGTELTIGPFEQVRFSGYGFGGPGQEGLGYRADYCDVYALPPHPKLPKVFAESGKVASQSPGGRWTIYAEDVGYFDAEQAEVRTDEPAEPRWHHGGLPPPEYEMLVFKTARGAFTGYYDGGSFKSVVPDYDRGARTTEWFKPQDVLGWFLVSELTT